MHPDVAFHAIVVLLVGRLASIQASWIIGTRLLELSNGYADKLGPLNQGNAA